MLEKVFRRQAYYIASVVFIVMGVVYFLACIQQPFIGLGIKNINGQWLVTTSDPNGEGYKSGIQVGDQILKINEENTGKYRFVQKWGDAEGASTIEFRRAGQISDSIITIHKQPVLRIILSDCSMYILGFVFWFLGFMTWFKRSFLVQARTLFWLNWLIAMAFVLAHASSRDLLFARELESITLSLVPMFLISFVSIFPINNNNGINRVGYYISIIIFLIILSLTFIQSVGIVHLISLLRKLMLSNMIIGILFVLWNLGLSIRLLKDKPEKNQSGIILLGMVTGFLPSVLLTAIPTIFNYQQLVYAQVSSLFISFIPISLYYVIVNKYLPDSRRLFRTIISHVIAGVIICFIVTYALFFLQIVKTLDFEIYLATLFLTMLLIVCFNFMRVVTSKFLVKYSFFKGKQGFKQRIIELNENLTSLFAEDRILEEMLNKLEIEGAFIIIENAQKGCLKKAAGRFQEKRNEQTELEIFFHNDQRIDLEAKKLPDDFPAEIYVPFISHDSTCAIFFGHRYSRIKFEQAELPFLGLLAGQLAHRLIMSLIIGELTKEIKFLTQSSLNSQRRNQELQGITNSLFRNLEQERKLIACEIHDGPLQLGSDLSRWFKYLDEESPPDDRKQKVISHMWDLVENFNYELSLIFNNLHPPTLTDLGLLPSIELLCQEIMLKELSLISLETAGISHENRFTEEIELTAYRFLQEGVINSVRHSGSNKQRIHIELNESRLELTVSDSGRGFDTSQIENWLLTGAHFGIVEMKERIESLGGELQISSVIHQGTVLKATIPVV